MMASGKVDISVVVPVFYSAQIFPVLYERLVNTLEKVTGSFEIIAVVDGCTDNSAAVISEVNARDSRVKMIEFWQPDGDYCRAALQHR